MVRQIEIEIKILNFIQWKFFSVSIIDYKYMCDICQQ